MLLLVLFVSTVVRVSSGQCESGFADTCFASVQEDLKFMLNIVQNLARNVSHQAVGELCLSIDDALNCTSDIIDTDCTFGEGRGIFDSWLKALRAVYHYLCGSGAEKLKDILGSIQCWNVNRFFTCTKDKAGLGHVRELLHVVLDDQECMELWKTFKGCYNVAQVSSCREQENIEDEFHEMVNVFFAASYCSFPLSSEAVTSMPSLVNPFSLWLISIAVIFYT